MRDAGERRMARDDGAAAVEFALVVIPLLLIVFGLIQFGLYFFQYQGTAAAAREGARQAAVGKSCLEIETLTRSASPGGAATVVTTTLDGSPQVGENVVVTASVPAINIGFPLVPIPSVTITQDGVARIEVVNSTWPVSGC